MPNKYEREIEEILRNLETTDPRPGLGQRFGERLRRKPDYRVKPRRRGFPSLNFSMSEWLIIIAVIAALISGGYAYAVDEPNVITGIFAIAGAVCLLLAVLTSFISHSRQSPYSRRPSSSPDYSNVSPIRRNPLGSIATRWHLFLLKMRYRRKNGR
jgi:hypothetical protein